MKIITYRIQFSSYFNISLRKLLEVTNCLISFLILIFIKKKNVVKREGFFPSLNCSLMLKIDVQSLDSENNWFDYMATDSNSFQMFFLKFVSTQTSNDVIKGLRLHVAKRTIRTIVRKIESKWFLFTYLKKLFETKGKVLISYFTKNNKGWLHMK